ncbi:kinase-like protein [Peniophora sp. CONT]|nr:kinase-like protein [Peniophora sp. CONT]
MSFDKLQIKNFAYDSDIGPRQPESPLVYRPGGFHPVILGSVISSAKTRYHVVHKLGSGGYATVWLVQDLSSYAWYALRVRMASCSCEGEDDVLDRLRSMPRSPHLPTIFDIFTIEGPNGRHVVIVADIIAPLDDTLNQIRNERLDLKTIVRGLVEAVADLHGSGIIHGDLHVRNVGLAMPLHGLEVKPSAPLRCPVLAQAELIPVVGETPEVLELSSHFPPYLVCPIELGAYYEELRDAKEPHVVKLFDFGNAHLVEKPRPAGGFMSSIAPPEWTIVNSIDKQAKIVFDAASDIWALGLLIFNVMTGGRSLIPRTNDRLSEMVKLAGAVPSSWDVYPAANVLSASGITPRSADNLWQQHRADLRNVCSSEQDVDALIALLRRVLVLDPAARPSAADILRDPWFTLAHRSDRSPGSTRSSAQRTGTSPNYMHGPPPVPYPHNGVQGAQHVPMYPGQYGAFQPQPQYFSPPSVHPAAYAHPLNHHVPFNPHASNHGQAPYTALNTPQYFMAAGAWTPRA